MYTRLPSPPLPLLLHPVSASASCRLPTCWVSLPPRFASHPACFRKFMSVRYRDVPCARFEPPERFFPRIRDIFRTPSSFNDPLPPPPTPLIYPRHNFTIKIRRKIKTIRLAGDTSPALMRRKNGTKYVCGQVIRTVRMKIVSSTSSIPPAFCCLHVIVQEI